MEKEFQSSFPDYTDTSDCGLETERRTKSGKEIQDVLNAACPKTTMSQAEIVNAYIDQCCGNSFAEAEKFFRKMGDNSGIASVDHFEKF